MLINLVENLLSVTRIEDGRLNLKMSVELIDEVTAESIRHLPRKSAEYQIHLKKNDEFLMAKMDVRLILQVITKKHRQLYELMLNQIKKDM